MTNKIRSNSASTFAQQCFEQLQDQIIQGILKPGEKLKIASLKNYFQIGQSPIREALSRLVSLGLVQAHDNRGFTVATISEHDIRDTYRTFTMIENMALEQAIKEGDDSWQASIVAALHKLSLIECTTANADCSLWTERNYDFHLALIAGCNSPTLLEVRQAVYLKFDRYCRLSYELNKKNLSHNHEEHQQLAQAVLARDCHKAQSLMSHHINGALEDIIKKLKEAHLI